MTERKPQRPIEHTASGGIRLQREGLPVDMHQPHGIDLMRLEPPLREKLLLAGIEEIADLQGLKTQGLIGNIEGITSEEAEIVDQNMQTIRDLTVQYAALTNILVLSQFAPWKTDPPPDHLQRIEEIRAYVLNIVPQNQQEAARLYGYEQPSHQDEQSGMQVWEELVDVFELRDKFYRRQNRPNTDENPL